MLLKFIGGSFRVRPAGPVAPSIGSILAHDRRSGSPGLAYRDGVKRDDGRPRVAATEQVGLAERLRALADLVPLLESAAAAEFGRWDVPSPKGGVHSLGYYVFGPVGEAFLAAVRHNGWVVTGFAWPAWLETDEGRALRDRPDAVAAAGPEDLARLLTAIIRSDRFVEGSIAGAFESGLLARIARRAAVLLAESGGG
jgi:hypothetical protein